MINEENYLEILLKRLYQRRSTILGISPISEYTIVSSLRAANRLNAPLLFVASLNQIDIDGGYTGLTPSSFVKFVVDVIRKYDMNVKMLFQVDHCGPWLKDDHVVRNYSYNEALNAVLRSLEEFIKAGFSLVHIDTTVDLESSSGVADVKVAAERTVKLIDLVEDISRNLGLYVRYEIGSDRWGYKPINVFSEFVSYVIMGLKEKRIDPKKIVFVVADVGTKVKPGNKVHEDVLVQYSNTALQYDYLLKIHSGDYLENPSILPRCRVGGVNIGPMFADIQYRLIKQALVELQKDELIDKLYTLIMRSDKTGKYTKKERIEEYEIGVASRYIWSTREAYEIINIIEKHGIPITRRVLEKVEEVVEFYMKELNLQDL